VNIRKVILKIRTVNKWFWYETSDGCSTPKCLGSEKAITSFPSNLVPQLWVFTRVPAIACKLIAGSVLNISVANFYF
jgi:hypothetical protein